MESEAEKIAVLNDALRRHGTGGRIVITSGIQALGQEATNRILRKVRAFDKFSEGNNPYGERDFGAVSEGGEKIFWKINYYDRNMAYHSPDPADPTLTIRLLTIMLASEY
ncbi:MAG: DUF3768 domain-containing protein [Rhodospirillaceae bacterium]